MTCVICNFAKHKTCTAGNVKCKFTYRFNFLRCPVFSFFTNANSFTEFDCDWQQRITPKECNVCQ